MFSMTWCCGFSEKKNTMKIWMTLCCFGSGRWSENVEISHWQRFNHRSRKGSDVEKWTAWWFQPIRQIRWKLEITLSNMVDEQLLCKPTWLVCKVIVLSKMPIARPLRVMPPIREHVPYCFSIEKDLLHTIIHRKMFHTQKHVPLIAGIDFAFGDD